MILPDGGPKVGGDNIRPATRFFMEIGMKRWPRFIVTFLILIGLAGLLRSSLKASPQAPPPASAPLYSAGPVTDYNAAIPNNNDVLRFRRGERYSSPNSSSPELGEDADPILITTDTGNLQRDTLPFKDSDAVVVGTITSGQAYLSNDKRDIYSEFKLSVQEIIKMPTEPALREGDTVDIERHGGVVKLPTGKILVRSSKDYSMPSIGKRYLLFLKYDASTRDFHLLTAYLFHGGHVYELDDLEHAGQNTSESKLIHELREHPENEQKFLSHVKAAKPPNEGGN
jgi:hypothetical protein